VGSKTLWPNYINRTILEKDLKKGSIFLKKRFKETAPQKRNRIIAQKKNAT
jgi:hypothetical protein